MLHVKYKLKKSTLHGMGLFADEVIKPGTLIYTASPMLDVNITAAQFDRLHESERAEIRYWGFWAEDTQVWHVDFDASKFINHSFEPTITQHPDYKDTYLIAMREINFGDELTQNYLEFESVDDLRNREIKIS